MVIPLVIIRNICSVNDCFSHAMKSDTVFIPRAKAIKVNWFLHLERDYVVARHFNSYGQRYCGTMARFYNSNENNE